MIDHRGYYAHKLSSGGIKLSLKRIKEMSRGLEISDRVLSWAQCFVFARAPSCTQSLKLCE